MDREEELALVALNCRARLGAAGIHELIRQAGSAAAVLAGPQIWSMPWRRRVSLPDRAALLDRAWAELARLETLGAEALTRATSGYPERFHQLAHPPALVALLGQREALEGPERRVALVGARACTPYGREHAARLGRECAAAGAVVVSGAARGIDQAGMRGALEAGGRVVAVIGSGLDRPYPPEAGPLLRAVTEAGGAVISEFPCGTAPVRGNFPRRNRLIAALSDAVVVVQATRRSGSMITAGFAGDLGREVFGVPGPLDSVVSHGPHDLIRDGGHLAGSAKEVLELLDPAPLGAVEEPALEAIGPEGASLAELAIAVGEAEDLLQFRLVELELRGLVTRRPGGLYHRCGPCVARSRPSA